MLKRMIKLLQRYFERKYGVEIYIDISARKCTEEQAEKIMTNISNELGVEFIDESGAKYQWKTIKDYQNNINVTVFYEPSKEKKIKELEEKLSQLKAEQQTAV